VVLPSLPTACPTRLSSRAMRPLADTMSLNMSAILPASPVQWPEGAPRSRRCGRPAGSPAGSAGRVPSRLPLRRCWPPRRRLRLSLSMVALRARRPGRDQPANPSELGQGPPVATPVGSGPVGPSVGEPILAAALWRPP
jgi:hypothetical protein